MNTNSNEPWSEQYRLAGRRHADLEAAASLLEESKSAVLAQKKSELGDIADNKAERLVKASPQWSDYITKMVEARRQANIAKVDKEFVQMRYWEEQSANANARTEMRM